MTGGLRGRLIALEGIDGCGKSTQAALLAERLGPARAGRLGGSSGALQTDQQGVLLTFEPGATVLGRTLRTTLLAADHPPISLRAEALLMAADRAQHLAEVVEPALTAGRWVVTDRYSGSTLAYQGYGRGLDVGELEQLVEWATAGVAADLSIVVDVPVEVGSHRRRTVADRFEGLGEPFQRRVADGFARLAADGPGDWALVDGTGSVADVADAVWAVVVERFGAELQGAAGR